MLPPLQWLCRLGESRKWRTERTIVTTFLLYSSIFIILAFFESRHLHNHEDYFVASRKAGSIQTGFSVIASCVGASATIGMCGLAFSIDLPAIWWLLSGVLGLIILRVFLLIRPRKSALWLSLPHGLLFWLRNFPPWEALCLRCRRSVPLMLCS